MVSRVRLSRMPCGGHSALVFIRMDTGFGDRDGVLRDGRTVHIRAVRSADEADLLRAFDRLSPHARYMRFMRFVREPNVERLRQVIASFPDNGDGIVATIPVAGGIDIVGGAIFLIGGDPTSCEFAITVAGDFGGTGLATMLMGALIDLAKRRGMQEMEGVVLAENHSMLRLATRLGFGIESGPEDRAVRICRLRIGDA